MASSSVNCFHDIIILFPVSQKHALACVIFQNYLIFLLQACQEMCSTHFGARLNDVRNVSRMHSSHQSHISIHIFAAGSVCIRAQRPRHCIPRDNTPFAPPMVQSESKMIFWPMVFIYVHSYSNTSETGPFCVFYLNIRIKLPCQDWHSF